MLNKFAQKQKENPFYGMDGMLDMFQQLPKVGSNPVKSTVFSYLTRAYKECKTDEHKMLFYSIVFSIGDIANREHNVYRRFQIKKVDNGGNSLRNAFVYCLEWMLTHDAFTSAQFYAFLPILSEYTNFENLFINRLVTDRNKGKVLNTLQLPIDIDKVTNYLALLINNPTTPDNTHALLAKFLPADSTIKPRKRTRVVPANKKPFYSKKLGRDVNPGDVFSYKTNIKKETVAREKFRYDFLLELSKKLDWSVIHYKNNARFVGVVKYKQKWNALSEARLFSQKTILNMDKEQFLDWVNKLPAGARYRVQRRLCDKTASGTLISRNKWVNVYGNDLGELFIAWEKGKVVAQETLLNLTDKEKAEMSKTDLKKIEKAARINTGSDTLVSALAKLKAGGITMNEAKLLSQSVLNKIKLDVPVFVFGDVSSSMQMSNAFNIEGVQFRPFDMMTIAATAFLMKNPMPELQSILGIFSTNMDILSDYNYKVHSRQNRYVYNNNPKTGDKLLIDKTKSFVENWQHIHSILSSYDFGSTRIEEVSNSLKRWVESDPIVKNERIEQVAKYPIHLYISDGDFNSSYNATQSLLNHRQNMKQWFGWDGIIVVWDVKTESKGDGAKFKGVPNVLYFGSNNIGVINQVFTNISDLDIVDTYLPLKALANSNRYAPVREHVITANAPVKSANVIAQ